MQPRKFDDSNRLYVADGCGDLPIQDDGEMLLSCWQMSWRERLSALIYGRAWLCLHSRSHPPVWVRVEKDCHGEPAEAREKEGGG